MLPQFFFQTLSSPAQKLALPKVMVNSSFFRDCTFWCSICICLFLAHPAFLYSQTEDSAFSYAPSKDPVIVRVGESAYELVDEAALAVGHARPFMEGPATAGALWRSARNSSEADVSESGDYVLSTLAALLPRPRGPAEAAFIISLSGGWEGIPDPDTRETSTNFTAPNNRAYLESVRFAELLKRDPIADLRFLFRTGPVALDLNPAIRPSSSLYRSADGFWTNAVSLVEPDRIDVNFPYRGITSLSAEPFEFRLGRDKLQLGPGRHSSLGIAYNLPWADFVSAKADVGPFSFSWYLIALNPVITKDEEAYLVSLRENPGLQLEDNSSYQLQGLERSKTLVASRLTWRPIPSLAIALTQHHLIGGRYPQLADFNPFIIFHNLFQEGMYSVPPTTDFSFVPVKGLELYGQGMIYDATVADEVGSDTGNAAAYGWQFGLTAISTPWFNSGPGRLRLDLEYVISDPWMYGKYISWRQFTSRYVFVEPYSGRFWVDYPIGFHLGPDAWELWGKLAYGIPAGSNISVETDYAVKGSISLLGYGEKTDYANKQDFHDTQGVMVRDGQVPERSLKTIFVLDYKPEKYSLLANAGLSLSLGTTFNAVWGYNFTKGDERFWTDVSSTVRWSF